MSTKELVISAADALFYNGSIRMVSVDRLVERASITKKTLYYHLKSKDDFVAAYLEARLQPTFERYQAWAGQSGALPERIERMALTIKGQGIRSPSKQREWRITKDALTSCKPSLPGG